MTVTSRDVARAAGVSQPTVSRALRDDPRVAAQTRALVRRVADELGYVPSDVGRSLSTRSTRQVAMVADLDNALYPVLVGPLHDRFAEHGLRMVLLAERGDDRASYDRLLDRSVDGVVLTTTLVGSSLSAGLLERGLPFVELNRLSGLPGVDGVSADNVAGGAAAARLLLDAGHRRVAAVLGTRQTSTGRDREDGFRAELAAAGVELGPDRVCHGWFTREDGERSLAALLDTPDPPTAVFCVGDTVAVGVCNEALRRGLRVPGDLAVVGFDDLDIAGWPQFRLTTVRVELAAMAAAAADRLVARLHGDDGPPSVQVFPVTPVLRESHRATV